MVEKVRYNFVKKKIIYFVLYLFIVVLFLFLLLCLLWVGGRGFMLLNLLVILLVIFCLRLDDGR